jgi:hypothetical protein
MPADYSPESQRVKLAHGMALYEFDTSTARYMQLLTFLREGMRWAESIGR